MELYDLALGVLQDDVLRGVAQHATGGLLEHLNGLSLSGVGSDGDLSRCGEWMVENFTPSNP